MKDLRCFRWRAILIVTLTAVWAVLAAVHLFYYSVHQSKPLRRECAQIAWREGKIPAMRGRILDRNGIQLAWTEIRHDLHLESGGGKPSPARRERILRAIRAVMPLSPSAAPGDPVVKYNLSPVEIETAWQLAASFPELQVRMRLLRQIVDYDGVRRKVGHCGKDADGILHGVSGVEQTEDEKLRGTPGDFVVMLDKKGGWFEGTLKIRTPACDGEDVRLTESLAELKGDADESL